MQRVLVSPAETLESRAASTASGGTALTTTLGLIYLPWGSDYVALTARNFAGCNVARYALNPYLVILTTRASLTDTPVNISDEAQDGDTTDITMGAFSTAANGNFIYIGAAVPFRGVRVTVGSDPQNTAGVVLTVKYWTGNIWTSISATDGTSTTTSFDTTGNVTWTVPAAWASSSLSKIGDSARDIFPALYWTRWEFGATTEATWNFVGMQALNRSTAYAELVEGQAREFSLNTGQTQRKIASIEALTDAGTANLVVNVDSRRGFE